MSTADPSRTLEWDIHLARKNPTRAIAVMILIFICSIFVYYTLEDVFLTLISAFVLILMVIPYYLKVTYTLSDEGISKKMLFSKQFREWSEFHRYDVEKNTIKLYTMQKPSRLDNYRAFLVLCNKNKDDVLEYIDRKISVQKTS